MRKNSFIFLLTAIFAAFSLVSCGYFVQTAEMKRFAECEFSVVSAQFIEIGGVDVSKVKSFSDLGMVNMLSIGQQAMIGKLPAKLDVVLHVKNNSDKVAAISGLDYTVFIREQEMADGSLKEKVTVGPKSESTFPVIMNVEMISLMNSSSVDQILKIAVGNENQKQISDLGLKIQLKPYYLSGSTLKRYPGTISIKP